MCYFHNVRSSLVLFFIPFFILAKDTTYLVLRVRAKAQRKRKI
ncbi:hypothetical protein HMPREF3192_00717 [Atopobium deltae]|uniref:Uncharacterized protein n=1 Tax=Atopobium deltae TaxID=1393034 RepID=A0A133XV57_9ACTN|nr:hypothetical protein HMPREF3192_00717 [Atopobium deltae]